MSGHLLNVNNRAPVFARGKGRWPIAEDGERDLACDAMLTAMAA